MKRSKRRLSVMLLAGLSAAFLGSHTARAVRGVLNARRLVAKCK